MIIGSPAFAHSASSYDGAARYLRIGGDKISGSVRVEKYKYLRFAGFKLRANGRVLAQGRTNDLVQFSFPDLKPSEYNLEIRHWGEIPVRIDAKLDRAQRASWRVILLEGRCGAVSMKMG